jgi:hypothetical protein
LGNCNRVYGKAEIGLRLIRSSGRLLITILLVSLSHSPTATAAKEFSLTFFADRNYADFHDLNEVLANSGYDRLPENINQFGISVTWRFNKNVVVVLDNSAYSDFLSDQADNPIIDVFSRSTLFGVYFEDERFPFNIIEPGFGVGFGSFQLQIPSDGPPHPSQPYLGFTPFDSLMGNPIVESKLSRRFALLDLSLGTEITVGTREYEHLYSHKLVLRLKMGYIRSLASSSWRLGPLDIGDNPTIRMNYFYIRFQWGYGGRW